MPLDYSKESEKYLPNVVKTLLIAESPPPNGNTYFYVVPKSDSFYSKKKCPIEKDKRLSSTIFYHYFKKRPKNPQDYSELLDRLSEKKIFLMDISDKPLKINDKRFEHWRNPDALKGLINEIPNLRSKIENRCGTVDDKDIIFLLARNNYKKKLTSIFPNSEFIRWNKFRISEEKSQK